MKTGEERLEKLSKVKLPPRTSYWISRALAKLRSENKLTNQKVNDLVKQFGEEKVENSGMFSVKKENMKQYRDAVDELFKIEVEVDINILKVDDLGGAEIEPELVPEWLFEE